MVNRWNLKGGGHDLFKGTFLVFTSL